MRCGLCGKEINNGNLCEECQKKREEYLQNNELNNQKKEIGTLDKTNDIGNDNISTLDKTNGLKNEINLENNELNKFCRNCGKSLEKKEVICQRCGVKVSDKRVNSDNGYVIYLVLNLLCILSYSIVRQFNVKFCEILLIIALILITTAEKNYKKNKLIKFFYILELSIICLYLILLVVVFVSCVVICGGM